MSGKVSPLRTNHVWTRAEKLQVKHLYLKRNMTTGDIAKALDREPRQISVLVNRQGWAKARKDADERFMKEAEATIAEQHAEFVKSVADRSELMVEKGFDLAEKAGDAKDFVDAARGTQIFTNLARQAMGLDQQQAIGGVTVNLSQIFGNPVGPAEPKRVEPLPPTPLPEPVAAEHLDFA